jgi:hypothetical protein
MKTHLIAAAAISLLFSSIVEAHCPSFFKEEKVCFMLEKNLLYVYDHKLEHNGPYKDFAAAELKSLDDGKGAALTFSKIARGIYKINSLETQKMINANFLIHSKKKQIKINHEP